jgi:hypothetical protein
MKEGVRCLLGTGMLAGGIANRAGDATQAQ